MIIKKIVSLPFFPQQLLRKAVDVELEKQHQRRKITEDSFLLVSLRMNLVHWKWIILLVIFNTSALSLSLFQREYLKEMASSLFDDDHRNDESSSLASLSVGKPVVVETKTSQQRNREKLQKKKEPLAKAAKEKRIRDHELFRWEKRWRIEKEKIESMI